ncbi:MAG TPA: ABC-2 family transporter protein [Candidatus Acidoferrales bacterium]|nr:ABC-2 family transporter protein [Candidatus Acidoferrales bacterium]
MSAAPATALAPHRRSFGGALGPYLEFSRVGFVNILAFRLRYYTGILTYLINVTVYYFIWRAVFAQSSGVLSSASGSIAGYDLAQMLTYVSVGWIIRSFYWNTIDQEMAYEVIEGKIAMDMLKPVSVQWMWLTRAMGESAFRLILLTAPTAVIIALVFPVRPPASLSHFLLFLLSAAGSFLLMGAINFAIGTCAIPLKSILALIRAKFWLIELLSGLLIPLTFFPASIQKISSWLPFEHIAYTPLQIYLGKLGGAACAWALAKQFAWVIALLWVGHQWWKQATRKITIQGG